MPEGPEVRKIAETVAERVSGRTLISIEVLSGRYLDKKPGGLTFFTNALPKRVVGAGAHGKFMYWILDDELSIWSTLGMTGCWEKDATKHSRVKFTLNDGSIFFSDQRNFGTLKFVRGKFKLIEKLKSLGPDMLADDISDELFMKRLKENQAWEITQALMDQAVIAGVGNYIKADALWLAKISPHRMICDLSDEELSNLNRCIKQIMRESYQSAGATIKTYKNFDDHQNERGRKFLVYNQKTDPDGNQVVKELTEDNRTTHWCPSVQV